MDDDLTTFLESGCSTVVGLLTPAGEPFATRGWGIEVLECDPPRLRLLLGTAAITSLGHRPGDGGRFPIAVTGADVLSLRSVQVKGTAHSVEPIDDADRRRFDAYCDAFFGAVADVDGIRVQLMARLAYADLLACTVEVDEMYDQTPGPAAGAPLAARA